MGLPDSLTAARRRRAAVASWRNHGDQATSVPWSPHPQASEMAVDPRRGCHKGQARCRAGAWRATGPHHHCRHYQHHLDICFRSWNWPPRDLAPCQTQTGDTGTASINTPPWGGLRQPLLLPLSKKEPGLVCSGLGAPGSFHSRARPLPWPRLPQVSLRKTNAA